MKAALFDGNDIQVTMLPQPIPKNSQVLIRVKAAGICGTDLAILKGHLTTPKPLILGHEFSGEIVKVGKDVDQQWLGKRVTSEINSNIDFNCYYCKRNLFSQCVSRKSLGIDIDGAFAEYIVVESYLLHEFPPTISYNEATFIEPLAAAYQTFETMPLDQGDKTLTIFGAGKLGLLLIQVAKLKGLDLIIVDGSEKKLSLAQKFGASHIVNRIKTENIPKKIQTLTDGLGSDIVVDTSGNPEALKDIISSCRSRGKLHIKSTHGLPTPIDLTDIVVRELTLYSSRCGPFEKAINGLKSENIKVNELISKVYPLDKIQEAFDSYEKNPDHIKTIIKM